ncbi:MAG: hypothetical protein ACR2JE_03645 [Acidobacteriaceae bacterium]
MRRFQVKFVLTALLLVLTPVVPAVFAQNSQAHPAYANALSDLRYARALLDFGTYHDVSPMTAKAIEQIDIALKEIKEASMDDGKSLNDHPPVDSSRKPNQRFQDALAALNRAHTDVAGAEADPKAKGLRVEALHQIDAARVHTKEAYDRTLAEDPKH